MFISQQRIIIAISTSWVIRYQYVKSVDRGLLM